ncbi:DUF1007 family protein [Kiloniella laminariae]|uniref:DUF1007 family protein n=1 Tax=Kiloniella laminariae TaxID=454162 RepID=A0ABT4LMZ0_9PROT|nr:DUF1007 family protein [Kiloniella laminariae]MCZ4282255.1 DUF1007 family protein [Kiloniella laminariae]
MILSQPRSSCELITVIQPSLSLLKVCFRKFLTGTVVAILWGSAAQAHPHVWVDAAVIVHLNDSGRIVALEPVWIFDDLYTETLLQDLDQDLSGVVEKAELNSFAGDAVRNLHEWDYFLSARKAGAEKLVFTKEITADGDLLNNRLVLRFKLTLDQPIAFSQAIELKMYDPSYFISIDLVSENTANFVPSDAEGCTHQVIKPDDVTGTEKPLSDLFFSDEEVAANPELGSIFASTLRVSCS